MQIPEEINPSPSASVQRWHPKLTPYRLLVLGTTIGVGTAKAVAAQEDHGSLSTTLEWVFGVVIFLILYTMSTYDESPRDPPPHLEWLFHIDCMDYVWRSLSFFYISRPSYSSEPESTPPLTEKEYKPVPVTLYRLFVCFTTAFFGLAKATITYLGDSATANWVDWTLGVVLTSILFILGLYENNSIGIWHRFFIPDHGTRTRYGLSVVPFSFLTLISIWSFSQLIYAMPSRQYSSFLSTDDKPVFRADLPPLAALREDLLDACCILVLVYMLVVTSVFFGLASISGSFDMSGIVDVVGWMERLLVRGQGFMLLGSPGRRLAMRIASHFVILTLFLLGCAVYLAFWVVSIATNVEEWYKLHQSVTHPSVGHFASLATIILLQFGCAGATAFLMWFVPRKFFWPPLWSYLAGEENWDKALLF